MWDRVPDRHVLAALDLPAIYSGGALFPGEGHTTHRSCLRLRPAQSVNLLANLRPILSLMFFIPSPLSEGVLPEILDSHFNPIHSAF